MRYSTTINNLRAYEWGLDIKLSYLFAWFYELPSWADKLIIGNEAYYFASKTKAVEELPLLTDKVDTMYRYYKSIENHGLIVLKKVDGKDYVSLTEKGKKWNYLSDGSENNPSNSENNPSPVGNPSDSNSDKNPTYNNISINNSTINKDISNNTPLSKIKISDLEDGLVEYFEIARAFQLLFIKNLQESGAPTKHQEGAKFKAYVDPIRLMMLNDGVTKEQLQIVYRFLGGPAGSFWKPNILSTKKLREKFSQLIIKAQQNGQQITNNQVGGATDDYRRKVAAKLGLVQPD